jgi:hypothetical protein
MHDPKTKVHVADTVRLYPYAEQNIAYAPKGEGPNINRNASGTGPLLKATTNQTSRQGYAFNMLAVCVYKRPLSPQTEYADSTVLA